MTMINDQIHKQFEVGMNYPDSKISFYYVTDQQDWDEADCIFLNKEGTNWTGHTPTIEEIELFLMWVANQT